MTDLPHYANLRDGSLVEPDRYPAAAWVVLIAAVEATLVAAAILSLIIFAAVKALPQMAYDAAACPQLYLEGCTK